MEGGGGRGGREERGATTRKEGQGGEGRGSRDDEEGSARSGVRGALRMDVKNALPSAAGTPSYIKSTPAPRQPCRGHPAVATATAAAATPTPPQTRKRPRLPTRHGGLPVCLLSAVCPTHPPFPTRACCRQPWSHPPLPPTPPPRCRQPPSADASFPAGRHPTCTLSRAPNPPPRPSLHHPPPRPSTPTPHPSSAWGGGRARLARSWPGGGGAWWGRGRGGSHGGGAHGAPRHRPPAQFVRSTMTEGPCTNVLYKRPSATRIRKYLCGNSPERLPHVSMQQQGYL